MVEPSAVPWVREQLRAELVEQKALNEVLWRQVERYVEQIHELRKTLEAVEWDNVGACMWCGASITVSNQHKPDCQRQKALRLDVPVDD